MYKIGIDVGGTNTDAVILDENLKLIHSVKIPTSEDIETGIAGALKQVLNETGIDRELVTHAMLGTTQCTNAIVERKKISQSRRSASWLPCNSFRFAIYGLARRYG